MIRVEDLILSSVPVKNPSVIFRKGLDGGMVLVNCDTGATIALNQTGSCIWGEINGRKDADQITAAVMNLFSQVPDCVSDDVKTLLTSLAKEGFIGYEIVSGLQNE